MLELLEVVFHVLEVLDAVCCSVCWRPWRVCLLEALDVMRCVLFCMHDGLDCGAKALKESSKHECRELQPAAKLVSSQCSQGCQKCA